MTQKKAKCALLLQSKRVIYLFSRISKAFKKVQKLRLSAVELKKKKNAILEVCGQRGVALLGRLRLPQVAKLKSFILFFFLKGTQS